MPNEIRADMLKVKRMVSEVEMIIGKREGETELVNKLIDAENLLTYCMSRLENAIVPPCKVGDTVWLLTKNVSMPGIKTSLGMLANNIGKMCIITRCVVVPEKTKTASNFSVKREKWNCISGRWFGSLFCWLMKILCLEKIFFSPKKKQKKP